MNEPLNVSAIALDEDGEALYARHVDDRVRKMNAEGAMVWETLVPAGRFPVPPTIRAGRVYICSNAGTLSVLDARDGAKIWTYQATPGFYVMAPVAVSDDGVCFIAGMDGSLTAVRQQTR
jgi:outer membrane protein assembly factor BamB